MSEALLTPAEIAPKQYAKMHNVSSRTVERWCGMGLIGRRVGGRWKLRPNEPPPVINQSTKRKTGRVRRSARLVNFKRELKEDQPNA